MHALSGSVIKFNAYAPAHRMPPQKHVAAKSPQRQDSEQRSSHRRDKQSSLDTPFLRSNKALGPKTFDLRNLLHASKSAPKLGPLGLASASRHSK